MKAAIFPGQGVHGAGMAGGLDAEQPAIFDEASRALGVDVTELCREGHSGEADLGSTRWAQPAILVSSVAAALTLKARGASFDALAGHSLGEYSALVVGGSLSVGDGVRLVGIRAEAMDRAGKASPGGMAAVMGLERETVDELCVAHGAVVAGDNAPGQLVVSGSHEAVDAVLGAVKGAKGKGMRLQVAAAFHSPAMAAASDDLAAALAETDIAEPRTTVWSTTTAAPVRGSGEIRSALIEQLTKPVLWRQTIERMVESGVKSFVDTGPGQVVANMVRRIAPTAETESGVVAHADR